MRNQGTSKFLGAMQQYIAAAPQANRATQSASWVYSKGAHTCQAIHNGHQEGARGRVAGDFCQDGDQKT